ncbi:hypothetical protein BX666DRAFT_1656216 [Dichotomocladium elegans]|nr:hypothetical protein BX666DRAFT_1656216 [Dichotomocladium elegans]
MSLRSTSICTGNCGWSKRCEKDLSCRRHRHQSPMDVMGKFPAMIGYYPVMDDTSSHQDRNIVKYIHA